MRVSFSFRLRTPAFKQGLVPDVSKSLGMPGFLQKAFLFRPISNYNDTTNLNLLNDGIRALTQDGWRIVSTSVVTNSEPTGGSATIVFCRKRKGSTRRASGDD
jgi:hypothetical protein